MLYCWCVIGLALSVNFDERKRTIPRQRPKESRCDLRCPTNIWCDTSTHILLFILYGLQPCIVYAFDELIVMREEHKVRDSVARVYTYSCVVSLCVYFTENVFSVLVCLFPLYDELLAVRSVFLVCPPVVEICVYQWRLGRQSTQQKYVSLCVALLFACWSINMVRVVHGMLV